MHDEKTASEIPEPDPSIQFLDASGQAPLEIQIVSPTVPQYHSAPHHPPARPISGGRVLATIFGWLALAVVVLGVVRFLLPSFAEELQYALTRGQQRAEHELAGEQLQSAPLGDFSRAFQLVSQRVGPSVVHINTTSFESETDEGDLVELLGPENRRRHRQGQGSGVIMEDAGYILTNYHVIRGSGEIEVHLSDGRTVDATVVGHDAPTDLAVLKIDADSLIAADWGESQELEVGSLVWAVGSPFGLERTITFGILSAKHRAGQAGTVYQDFLQTDAAVNPGNSGGPLVDSQGRVIGINTAIVGQTYQGISFAVPSDVARDVYDRLKTDRRVARGWLGVALDDVDDGRAKELGLKEATGAYVQTVVDDRYGDISPARRANVKVGDVIIRFDGVAIDGPATLSRQVAKTAVGARVPVVLMRDGSRLALEVTIGQRPDILN